MIEAAKLAGFLAAQAIWDLSTGAALAPVLGYGDSGEERRLERLPLPDLRSRLDGNPMKTSRAVLLHEGVGAILLEMRAYASPKSRVIIAIPFTPASSGRFEVGGPKFLTFEHCEAFAPEAVGEALFEGVAAHEPGARLWNESLDAS
ncbi:MAG TPA: hypothetical protein VKT70_14795 [Stellaceae bacterium]|nr:hypothetical protein [Stellaceae bacterium]